MGKEGKLFEKTLTKILQIRGKDYDSPDVTSNDQISLNSTIEPLKKKSSFKMAFISACQSSEIGKIFIKSGLVPVVIAVDSNQEIMDEVCKLFSNHFYRNLLNGMGI